MSRPGLEAGLSKSSQDTKAHATSEGAERMKQVTDNKMRDVKAGLAANIASQLPKSDRVASVKGLLRCDDDEARALISRGRRLQREKAARERVA